LLVEVVVAQTEEEVRVLVVYFKQVVLQLRLVLH
jgi:hypothetical protein